MARPKRPTDEESSAFLLDALERSMTKVLDGPVGSPGDLLAKTVPEINRRHHRSLVNAVVSASNTLTGTELTEDIENLTAICLAVLVGRVLGELPEKGHGDAEPK